MNTEQMRALADEMGGWIKEAKAASALRGAADRIDALEGALRDVIAFADGRDRVRARRPQREIQVCDWMRAHARAVLASESLNTGEPTPAVPGVANEGDA